MKKIGLKIKGLDCVEEVAILKRAVGPVVEGEKHLSFGHGQKKYCPVENYLYNAVHVSVDSGYCINFLYRLAGSYRVFVSTL